MPATAQPETCPQTGPITAPASRRIVFLAALALAIGVLAAYQNIFAEPFVFDDAPAILENPTIRQLWPPWTALIPPPGTGSSVGGRPLINYSFALNYAMSGYAVWSYHVFNLIIHVLVVWLLFGIVRRTLLRPGVAASLQGEALPLAFWIALLWAVHPLLTETVTCVVQRTESLGALFYLLIFYCFIRSLDSSRATAWRAGAVVACLLGVASKETVVTAPVLALLYDRTFAAGTFARAWQVRRKFYAALCSSWLVLAGLMLGAQQRGGTVGFGLGMVWWQYALKQCEAVTHYLVLSVWPHPLAIDYGNTVITNITRVWPQALVLGALLAATGWALVRRPMLGFSGAWAFLILAPSSSIVPLTTQTEAEHRMYLPLVALVALLVVTLYFWAGRRAYVLLGILSLVAGCLTFQRNEEYGTTVRLWQENIANQPEVARAHESYGIALTAARRLPEAEEELRQGLRLQPSFPDCENDLANVLVLQGKNAESIPHYARFVAGPPNAAHATAYFSMGNALRAIDQPQRALEAYRHAVALRPNFAEAYNNQGAILEMSGQVAPAIQLFQAAVRADPNYAVSELNLANAYFENHQPDAALPHYAKAIAKDPLNAAAHLDFANALANLNRWDDAEKQYTLAESIQPNQTDIHYNHGLSLMKLGRIYAAMTEFEKVLRLKPDHAQARAALEQIHVIPTDASGTQPPTP